MRAPAALALALALAVPASAQDAPRADLFGGYSLVRSDGVSFHGWNVAGGWRVSGRIAVTLDLSGHGATDAEGTDVDMLAVMAGPRFYVATGSRLRPFVHLLAGLVRSSGGIDVFDVRISESRTDFGGAAGGGVDFGIGDRWAVRGAADYRVLEADGETVSDPRFSAGVVYRFAR